MRAKVSRWGNSLAVRLPKTLAQELGLAEDDGLELEICDGNLILRPTRRASRLEELVARITDQNRHQEIDWGPAVGAEFS
ncbi:MAG: AbrB/MazE/SpoVT family DNA-binding domain-containing protein [Candidatus Eremiobacterota bacterium]